MPHNVASDQGLHYLLTKLEYKQQKRPDTPKMTNGLVHHITVEESTSEQWVKEQSSLGLHCLLRGPSDPVLRTFKVIFYDHRYGLQDCLFCAVINVLQKKSAVLVYHFT